MIAGLDVAGRLVVTITNPRTSEAMIVDERRGVMGWLRADAK